MQRFSPPPPRPAQGAAADPAVEAEADARELLVSILVHELRTPVQALSIGTDLMLAKVSEGDAVDPEWLRQHLLRSRKSVARVRQLIDTVANAAQVAAGGLDLARERIDLGHLVREILTRDAEELAWARCRATLHVEGDVTGHWDRLQVDLAITNVLSNAMKYGRGAPIALKVWSDEGTAFCSVRDHGPGIPTELRDRLFDRFWRSGVTSHVPGLGLGLWITRYAVRAHGGDVAVISELGAGSTFTLSLPCGEPRAGSAGAGDVGESGVDGAQQRA